MKWRIGVRPEVEQDILNAVTWYEEKREGLGDEFREEVIRVLDSLENNPFLNSRRHPQKHIRWRYPDRFPYRVIYEVIEDEHSVVVAAVIHAARHDRKWRSRI
jgi:toxin ParE1/3/4